MHVELRGIEKRFPGVVANHDVDLTIRPGAVHALIGENGAGKSTLMKILYGVQAPDGGTIVVDGAERRFASPTDAIDTGIGMVFQHFMLADNLTVLENVVLGAEKLHGIGESARSRVREICEAYGFELDPDALVATLGVAARQRVEILKVLYRGASLIILDEPTAVLVPHEVEALFANLRDLVASGRSVLFISHKLDEVLDIADDITVMRRGTTVGTADPRSATKHELAELMVGAELPSPDLSEDTVTDVPILALRGVALASDGGRRLLDDVDLTVHRGEIVGIAGVEGNGQTELVEVIMGMRRATSGTITLAEEDITRLATRKVRERGVGFIPEDRHRHGVVLDFPLWENRILGHQTKRPVTRGPLLNPGGAREDAERIVAEYDVRTPSVHTSARALSGGNQQKFIVGREMSGDPVLLVASHPTRGVDVGAQAAIWDHIRRARHDGLGVLLISADLDELIGLSDRLEVILRGRITAHFDPDDVSAQDLGAAMTGGAA
ncbi:ABC transporter ATP-binding protein [Aeromicrobium phragmitis]|uniref:ABC transporter ATP-binding protein n=1 Tax=Aeromicrobium phragmitis TaxID=2478914 RepID=A0A3L8PNL2_9ACTN|nr:ABC transporter ATP-binding protein [Aeromicrobium phragmitis]RLV55572.1 ABC transporter ATP-binding protein [Aeromicrobium phragmitis]